MKELTTTLNKMRDCLDDHVCADEWNGLLQFLGKTEADDEPLPLETVLGKDTLLAIWALRAVDGYDNAKLLFGCSCAWKVLPIFESVHPDDKRSRQAVDTAERFAYGAVTKEELCAARDAAKRATKITGFLRGEWEAAVAAEWTAILGVNGPLRASKYALSAIWYAAYDNLPPRVAWSAAEAALSAALADFKREFRRMCRLEGEYGEVSARELEVFS